MDPMRLIKVRWTEVTDSQLSPIQLQQGLKPGFPEPENPGNH